jgi:hypothetical protein
VRDIRSLQLGEVSELSRDSQTLAKLTRCPYVVLGLSSFFGQLREHDVFTTWACNRHPNASMQPDASMCFQSPSWNPQHRMCLSFALMPSFVLDGFITDGGAGFIQG